MNIPTSKGKYEGKHGEEEKQSNHFSDPLLREGIFNEDDGRKYHTKTHVHNEDRAEFAVKTEAQGLET